MLATAAESSFVILNPTRQLRSEQARH